MKVFDATAGWRPQGGTFSANPLFIRAGLVAIRYLDHAAVGYLEMLGNVARTVVMEPSQSALRRCL